MHHKQQSPQTLLAFHSIWRQNRYDRLPVTEREVLLCKLVNCGGEYLLGGVDTENRVYEIDLN